MKVLKNEENSQQTKRKKDKKIWVAGIKNPYRDQNGRISANELLTNTKKELVKYVKNRIKK